MEMLKLHQVMNSCEAQLEQLDEFRLEHYIKDILPLEKKARADQDIPYNLAGETFNRAETNFIDKFFKGSTNDYNMWKKENENYIEGDK